MKAIVITHQRDGIELPRQLIAAAALLAQDITLLVAGAMPAKFRDLPVSGILHIKNTAPLLADCYLPTIAGHLQTQKPDVVVASEDVFSNDLLVRLAYGQAATFLPRVFALQPNEGNVRLLRRTHAYSMESTYTAGAPLFFTVESGAFAPLQQDGTPALAVLQLALDAAGIEDYCEEKSAPEQGLASKALVLAGGRGLGSKAEMEKLAQLGQLLDAGVGATRPAVYSGWAGTSHMLGLSGTQISPEMCVVFGASGSMPFMKGVEKSRVLLAVNTDPEALVFSHCDYGVVASSAPLLDALLGMAQKESDGE